jgi:hypothetical protein
MMWILVQTILFTTKTLVHRCDLPFKKWKNEDYEEWLLITKHKEKWIGEVFWHKGVLEPIDKHKTSPNERYINPNQKFQLVIWF